MNHVHALPAQDVPPPERNEEHGVLTIAEAARELRCSKAHLHNIIHGKVPDLPPLPVLQVGRRVLIRAEAFRAWMLLIEAREMEARRLTGFFR